MESDGILNVENDSHIVALQLVYLPVIRDMMNRFVNSWNSHRGRFAGVRYGIPDLLWELGPKDPDNFRDALLEVPLRDLEFDYEATPNIQNIHLHILDLQDLRDRYIMAKEMLAAQI